MVKELSDEAYKDMVKKWDVKKRGLPVNAGIAHDVIMWRCIGRKKQMSLSRYCAEKNVSRDILYKWRNNPSGNYSQEIFMKLYE